MTVTVELTEDQVSELRGKMTLDLNTQMIPFIRLLRENTSMNLLEAKRIADIARFILNYRGDVSVKLARMLDLVKVAETFFSNEGTRRC